MSHFNSLSPSFDVFAKMKMEGIDHINNSDRREVQTIRNWRYKSAIGGCKIVKTLGHKVRAIQAGKKAYVILDTCRGIT